MRTASLFQYPELRAQELKGKAEASSQARRQNLVQLHILASTYS